MNIQGSHSTGLSDLLDSFHHYASLSPISTRIAEAYASPCLLAAENLRAIDDALKVTGCSADFETFLGELEGTRQHLARNPDDYPLGAGPIEHLLARHERGEISANEALHEAASPETFSALAPVYVHSVSWQLQSMGESDNWRRAALLALLLSTAVFGSDAVHPISMEHCDALAVTISLTIIALSRGIDDALYGAVSAIAERAIARAESLEDKKALGRLLQAFGTLYSDVYTVARAVETADDTIDIEKLLNRPRAVETVLSGVSVREMYPSARVALPKAVQIYRAALPYRIGLDQGLTYKAIAQSLGVMSIWAGDHARAEMIDAASRARPLLEKHPNRSHLVTIESLLHRSHKPRALAGNPISPSLQALLNAVQNVPRTIRFNPLRRIQAAFRGRLDSHRRAVHDLNRMAFFQLPVALYLRNFAHANKHEFLSDPIRIVDETKQSLTVIVPEISYSIVDHKLLELFPEGIVAICDPEWPNVDLRLSSIPALLIDNAKWRDVVTQLIPIATHVVVLLDELTAGVEFELNELIRQGAGRKTFVLTGMRYRTTPLPSPVSRNVFPFVGDWLDFSHDEIHANIRHKAHGLIQPILPRFLTANVAETVQLRKSWYDEARTT